MEVKQIGNMDNDRETFENPQCDRVYDSDGLSRTINTCQGGQREPKIIVAETKCLNSKGGRGGIEGLQPSVQDRVYDTGGVSTAITSSYMPSIMEKQIVAMRGRNPDNPSDRTAGSSTEQRLEPNSQGICNTLTSVQKDNLLLENICINDRGFSEKDPQVSIGTVPTLRAETHGNLPKVMIKQATKEGYIGCNIGGVADLSYPESDSRRGRVQGNGEISPTITATATGICRIESLYRIRKLTPLECWRLMGFSDEDFHKAEEVNSNSQLYKQAGNSIVKNVLMAIFGQMIPGKEIEECQK